MADRLRVFAFNACDALSESTRVEDTRRLRVGLAVVDILEASKADVAVIPEAFKEECGLSEGIRDRLVWAGYRVASTRYDDRDGRKDRHGLMVAGRPEVVAGFDTVQLAGRTALCATLANQGAFYGVHLDDRREQERVRQAQDLLRHMAATGPMDRPLFVAGDFNAVHAEDRWARGLRAVGPTIHRLPAVDPGEASPVVEVPMVGGVATLALRKLTRFASLGQRLVGMAHGGPLAMLEEAGFQDADPRHQATKGPVQLDHCMYHGDGVEVVDFRVHRTGGISDHEAITAEFVVC